MKGPNLKKRSSIAAVTLALILAVSGCDQAWKAAGFSSNTADYFDIKDAVLVAKK
jgi:hypothetical protein